MSKQQAYPGGDGLKASHEQSFKLNEDPITGGPILEPQVDPEALKRAMSAEDQAAALSHWQVLDIVHVHCTGPLQISPRVTPWRPLQELITLGILKRSGIAAKSVGYLVAGHRFRPVLEALWRSGRVKRPEVA